MGNDRRILGESPVQYAAFRTIMLDNAGCFGWKEYIVSVDQGKSISFKEFDECTNKVANFLSEAGWMIGNPSGKREIGSVGTPFRFKTIEILNQQGKKCNVGEEGEIVVKDKSIFKLTKIIRFLKEIPKTKNGKIAKRELLKLIREDKSN